MSGNFDKFKAQADELYDRAQKIWPSLTPMEFTAAGLAALERLGNNPRLSSYVVLQATKTELNRRFRHTGRQL